MLTRMPDKPARDTTVTDAPAADRILAAIRAVPHGSVAGYGHIAQRAGLPGRARLVARVLGQNKDSALPWHRILRSDGRIAFPARSPGFEEQSRRLRAEGVEVRNGRVRIAESDDSLDAAVWRPR
ncbi:methylated-DNA--protein-cysteine methyltransferase [Thermomonas carbonis]|uniref:MGMT family protein n=3 Tax=Thermomonas carbonis TaxID=1463158 RepID=A0A7G9SUE0_9GAMM|nr:MGMT family protein [Thermomonas carbonis]GHB98507.1 methylated-DNA--protein-cysteine methyltransferase [Thermomonas carbonis]